MLKTGKNKLSIEIGKLNKDKTEKDKADDEKNMLKFSDAINLLILDSLVPTKRVLELSEEFRQQEKEAASNWKGQAEVFGEEETVRGEKAYTKYLNQIATLGRTQMKLNKSLDSTNKQISHL